MNEIKIVSLSREGDVAMIAINNPPVNIINAALRAELGRAVAATAEILERCTAQAKKQYPNRTAALTAIKAVHASTKRAARFLTRKSLH